MSMTVPASVRDPRSGPSSSGRSGPPGAGDDGLSLIDAFGQFYGEVVLLKRRVTSGTAAGGLTPDTIRQTLVDLFEAQTLSVSKNAAQHEIRVFEEAQYVMVAMADEVFLRLSWAGREEWAKKPLEAHIFRTHDAGERFFARLDQILYQQATASTALLTVYLTALALGFQGKYAALGQKNEPENYRRKLATYVHRLDPIAMAPERELCPETSAHTKTGGARAALPSLMAGFYALIIVFIGWIVIGQVVWYYRTKEINNKLDQIEGQPSEPVNEPAKGNNNAAPAATSEPAKGGSEPPKGDSDPGKGGNGPGEGAK